ncbi:MAG TPA: hypothetical protein VG817_06360 [Gemmatimonadales bacterium]|nr:hypothetical protein [Gemmatimonadales bacterium]
MKIRLLLLFSFLASAPLAAQDRNCPADTTAVGRVCQAGVDALTLFLPTENLLVSGGNPVPGTAAAIGKFGHFRIGARVGLVRVTIPETSYNGTRDTVPADTRLLIPAPRLDLSVGIFSKALPIGTASVDLLGAAVILPTDVSSRYTVDENARRIESLALGLGFGFRAAMQMNGNKPTVSLSVMKRDMPALRFGDVGAGDDLSVATNLSSINGRLAVGGKLYGLRLTAGGGMDLIKGKGSVTFIDPATATDSTFAVDMSTSRITTFLNAALDLGPLSLWGEGGFTVGKDDGVITTFQRIDAAGGTFYGGLGAAISF